MMSTAVSRPPSDAQRVACALRRLGTVKGIDLSLDRVWHLLEALENPQERLPPVIHIAGTNGKGSTLAILRACLEAAGLRVHAYTSPHLVHFKERIRVAGALISDSFLADCLERVEQVRDGQPVTFFEATTCAALLAFADTSADVTLLETGLGGRLDATNVVNAPAMTILTPIGMDHEQFLGTRLESIALEKAHIIKPGVPCISARQDSAAAMVIGQRAADMGAPLFVEGRDFTAASDAGDRMTFSLGPLRWHLPRPSLPGLHQVQNAALALAALSALPTAVLPGWSRTTEGARQAAERGLQSIVWPARMHPLTRGPLVEILPKGWELWLDGAHNPQAGTMLGRFFTEWKDRPLDVIVGMMGRKDARGFFRPLAPHVHRLRAVPIPEEQNAKVPDSVAEAAIAEGIRDVMVAQDAQDALRSLGAHQEGLRRVLICGSLYLAGAILADNG